MGSVISFSAVLRTGRMARSVVAKSESATIIILPAIRIERHVDAPENGVQPRLGSGTRRRRRSRGTR
jgi:hypothetical protein